jgi:hypothetical protein
MSSEKKNAAKRDKTFRDLFSKDGKKGLEKLRQELTDRIQQQALVQSKRPAEPWRMGHAKPSASKTKKAHAADRTPKPNVNPLHKTERAQQRKTNVAQAFSWWSLPVEATVREDAPRTILVGDRARMETTLARGAGESAEAQEGLPLFVTVGLDFGTSCTKVVARFAEEAGSPAIAVPAPAYCRSGKNAYLWQTAVWIDSVGNFSAWPKHGAHLVRGLKQGLLGDDASDAVGVTGNAQLDISRLEAATAYLAFVIRYVRGWLLINQSSRFVGRKVAWFVNLGLPAATFDDARLVSTYRKAGAAALVAAASNESITSTTVRTAIEGKAAQSAAVSPGGAEELGICVVPEVAAEVTGFTKSPAAADGLYMMIDVGAMTLDVCTFRFRRRPRETDLYPILRAEVRPLGVEAYHWFTAAGRSEERFAQQCDRCFRQVIWDTKSTIDPRAANWRAGNDLVVFLVGGGAANPLHRKVVDAVGPWLSTHTGNDGIRLVDLPVPDSLEQPDGPVLFPRLAVAWGLSYPPTEIGEIRPASGVSAVPPATIKDITKVYLSKDQV